MTQAVDLKYFIEILKNLAFIFAQQSMISLSGYILGGVKINMLNQINSLNVMKKHLTRCLKVS
jgi:hypothetical protein